MNKYFLSCLLLLLMIQSCIAQPLQPATRTATLIEVWGLLKYYHPIVATGTQDWDSVFIQEYKAAAAYSDRASYNTHLQQWIKSVGDYQRFPVRSTHYDTAWTFSPPLQWMDADSNLNAATRSLLREVIRHRHTGPGYYAGLSDQGTQNAAFLHEPPYPDRAFPPEPYRLLALARYWNMIEYFFPYKHLLDQPWYTVPEELAPNLSAAKDTLEYFRALLELTARVQDSHARITTAKGTYVSSGGTYYCLPVGFTMIGGKAVVTAIYNDSLARIDDLQRGDVVLALDDTTIDERIRMAAPRIAASNRAVLYRDVAGRFNAGYTRQITLNIERNGTAARRTVQRFAPGAFRMPVDTPMVWKLLPGNIGYVNMGELSADSAAAVFARLAHTGGLILDLRSYPQWTVHIVCGLLSAHEAAFAKCTSPDLNYPGAFACGPNNTSGQTNRHPYKNRIAVLVDANTQSRGEWTAMAFRKVLHATVIGSQTAGADGNVSAIELPGGYKVWMTGLGVYYPDGTPTQRTGIVPDIACSQTIEGYRAGRDDVLERALTYLKKGE